MVGYSLYAATSAFELLSFIFNGFILSVLGVIFVSAGVGTVVGSLVSTAGKKLSAEWLGADDHP